ncbi:MAG TPA: ACP S-malonyltransferase, partial [Dehalococcoidia bacterium]|nr:ACP S-malonyltransferase [Dehalococcoidia bacterium]
MPSSSQLTHLIPQRLHQAPADPTLAIVFPGQGAQHAGMAARLYEASPAARQLFDEADAVLQTALSRLCFDGPEEALRRTANAQPAILVTALAFLAAALERGDLQRRPAFLAGHSLGEYTALVAAGALSFADALPLVRQRGLLMQQAGEGAMAAVLGLSEDMVDEICRLSAAQACNYNAPTQLVVGGPPDAVAAAAALARERGAKALPLNVSGAFHTPLMADAARDFARLVDAVPLRDPVIPVVGNVE